MKDKDNNSMSRRSFLKMGTAGMAVSLATPFNVLSDVYESEPSIKEITVLPVPGEFYRSIAMNAYDRGPKGKTGRTKIVRVILSDGTEGIGIEGYRRVDEETISGLRKLIGVKIRDIYKWKEEKIVDFSNQFKSFFQKPKFSFFESPILDALGKLSNKPVWALYGNSVRDKVDCYDGTLYFKDIELNTGASVLGDIASRIKDDGYKAIKMKVGRPSKWLQGEAGVDRDIEAFIAVREAVGSNFNIMTDANNGYKDHYEWGLRFLEECSPYDMYWIEELFPESVENYQRLKADLSNLNVPMRIAEGEGVSNMEAFDPYLKADVYHFIQPDMRTIGFSNILRCSKMAEKFGVSLIPHNWQSEVGKLMSIHAAKVRKNIQFAEDDRYHNLALDTSEYLFRDGQWIPPELPGWGIRLNDHYDYFKKSRKEIRIT